MSNSKYGVIGTWTLTEGRWEEQLQGLNDQVVPMARQIPGFVAGYWLGNGSEGRTFSMIIMEDEETARRFRDIVEENPMSREQAGVTLESLTIAEVTAEAHR